MESGRRSAASRDRRRVQARRRRNALAALAAVALGAGAVAGSRGGDGGGEAETASSPPPPSCPADVAADPRRLTGQMLVVRMESVATQPLLQAARRGELGGVVLFPEEGTPPGRLADEVAKLARAAAAGGAPAPVVTIDQEGGEVERLPSLPPDRTPEELADAGVDAARAEGEATGAALERIGIVADLAPVLDLREPEGFIGERSYGARPAAVAELASAFGEGLQAGGVAATAKHFPGLGQTSANTDLGASVVDADRGELERDLLPFAEAVEAGFAMVMASNAAYPAYDEEPAWRSRRLLEGILRRRLGFEGVVISDDLGAGAVVAGGSDEGEAAIGAAEAGVDLLLFALSDGRAAHAALRRALRSGELERRRLVASCDRVTALRERFAIEPGSP
jgi:beta-N-acetylhexosaminidase